MRKLKAQLREDINILISQNKLTKLNLFLAVYSCSPYNIIF